MAAPASSNPTAQEAEFHLHPHYRERPPLEPVLLKRTAGLDEFVSEKYHDQIAVILSAWSEDMRQPASALKEIAKSLSPDFLGCGFQAAASLILRRGPALDVQRLSFSSGASLRPQAFLGELHQYLSVFSRILTAEFQVTRIDAHSDGQLRNLVRYELVGVGHGFHREQRVGYWELHWDRTATGTYVLKKLNRPAEAGRIDDSGETRSRSSAPVFEDRTVHAFGENPSYAAQLLHGVDYWRTVLDSACGIDIYGHNGGSVGDIDGDGFDDLYICQPAGLPNRLYRNRGDGTFDDITDGSGAGLLENTACAIFADFNNNGRQDLLVIRANGPLLLVNQGNGKFRPRPDAFQFANAPQGTFTGAAAADYDRDGWLDIYFCLYVYYQGSDQYKYPTPYYDANNGPPNFLMRNNRDGTFRDVTAESGLNQNNTRYSFCCAWTDCNGDGWPDLYVANDFGRKNLYRNNGDGTFADVAPQTGVQDIGAGMSISCVDYDNDGSEDLYVADMWTAAGERITGREEFKTKASPKIRQMYQKHAMGNSLFWNKGTGVFEDRTVTAGVGMGRWAWSSDAWDFDHDGFPDLYVTNGMVSGPLREDLNSFFWRQVVANSPDEAKYFHAYEQGWNAVNELLREDLSWSGYERNIFYANNRDGTFSNVSATVGLDFIEDGRAFVLADFDHDGRMEVLLKNRNGPQLRLLKNVMADLPPSMAFRLRGSMSNRDAIGAAVTLQTELGRQTRMLQAGSGFLSQHSKEIFFGLGEARGPIKVSIRWPSGLIQTLEGLSPGHRVWVEEGAQPSRIESFHDVSNPSSSAIAQLSESLPARFETWLLSPVTAPDFSLPGVDGRAHSLSGLRGKPVVLHFWISSSRGSLEDLLALERLYPPSKALGVQVMSINFDEVKSRDIVRGGLRDHTIHFPVLFASEETTAIYNILYRSLFDRHRDLSLPTAFLINEKGEIVKIYQGPPNPDHVLEDFRNIPRSGAERVARALPFPADPGAFEFGRNYLSLGSAYFQRGYFDQAADSFRVAVREDPVSAEAHYGLGSVFLKQEKWGGAQASFEQAVTLKSSYPDTKPNAWNNLGLLAMREGRADLATGYFQKALHLNPEHLISLLNLGNAYRQEKRWGDAETTFERALAVWPEDPELNYGFGMVLAETDQPDAAYLYLQKALAFRPLYPEALNNLGVLYLRTQRRDEAVATFKRCIQMSPMFDQSYLNLAHVYAIEGDREKARATLFSLLKQHPDHAIARQRLDELK